MGLTTSSCEAVQHVLALLRIRQEPGGQVVEDRLLTQVEADHLGDVVVDRLVVGHSGAERVGEPHVPGPVRAHQAGHAEQRVRPELERVDEVVVDPAVDRVHAREAAGRAHVTDGVAHDEVGRLHELHAHLPGEEGVLEVGAVRGPGRPYDHHRVLTAARGRGPQRLEQEGRVVAHGAHVVLGEQLGEQAAHRDAVLEDVGDSGRRAHVVLEHLPAAVGVADEVAAGDVAPHAARWANAVSLAGEVGSA